MERGRLIVLNGGSSAGKTSLARAFQDAAPETWLHLGIDLFWFALPPEQLNLSHVSPEYYSWTSAIEADGREYFQIQPGPILDRDMSARYRAIRAYLDAGFDVIADDVVWKREWLEDMVAIFAGYRAWLVGVRVSEEEGARREIQRGDRHAGWNRGSARAAHRHAVYDIEIDTTDRPPRLLALELLESVEACPEPSAFAQLRERFETRG